MRNSLLVMLLVGIVIGIGYVTQHQPLIEERDRLNTERTQLEERARLNRESALAYIESLTQQRTELQGIIAELTNPTPENVTASEALRTLREISTSTGFVLANLNLTDPTIAPPLRELTVTASGSGVFTEVTGFLRGIQRNAGAVRVNNLSLRPNDASADPVINMSITVSFLFTQGGL